MGEQRKVLGPGVELGQRAGESFPEESWRMLASAQEKWRRALRWREGNMPAPREDSSWGLGTQREARVGGA